MPLCEIFFVRLGKMKYKKRTKKYTKHTCIKKRVFLWEICANVWSYFRISYSSVRENSIMWALRGISFRFYTVWSLCFPFFLVFIIFFQYGKFIIIIQKNAIQTNYMFGLFFSKNQYIEKWKVIIVIKFKRCHYPK